MLSAVPRRDCCNTTHLASCLYLAIAGPSNGSAFASDCKQAADEGALKSSSKAVLCCATHLLLGSADEGEAFWQEQHACACLLRGLLHACRTSIGMGSGCCAEHQTDCMPIIKRHTHLCKLAACDEISELVPDCRHLAHCHLGPLLCWRRCCCCHPDQLPVLLQEPHSAASWCR